MGLPLKDFLESEGSVSQV